MAIKRTQQRVGDAFREAFGRTPIGQRLQDIFGEAVELAKFRDVENLREEFGDLLCSVLAGINESGFNADELVDETLKKIQRRIGQYKSLGRKTRVAMLGGAFDPIHLGHIELAQFVLDAGHFDEVWLMPCYKHLLGKKLTDFAARADMCRLAAKCDARIKVSTYEYDNKFTGETYNLVKRLLEEDFAKNEYDFSFVVSMDNANIFHKWYNYEHLIKMIPFVVVSRQGVQPDPNVTWYLNNPPHIYLPAERSIMEISSTTIRTIVGNYRDDCDDDKVKDSIQKFVGEEVAEYIANMGLYRKPRF